jgi:TolB-like protein/DNA-binding winged helix-turn-helix (wHTH) protein/Tfp pilus assembly protein PilF
MANATSSGGLIRFGIFELDVSAGELRKRGTRLPIQGLPLQILGILAAKPAEVVTREELRNRLWPADTFVDFDHNIRNAVARLREALDDSAETPRYVETLPRRGYRFIGHVDTSSSARAMPEEQRAPVLLTSVNKWASKVAITLVVLAAIAGLGTLAYVRALRRGATAPIRSLAVLPLENLTGNPDQEYFVDGMTDALTTDLAQITDVRVISRTSAMQYKGVRKPLPEIAQALGVDAVVEGSVVRSGLRVRVTAQLIHAPTDRHLWAESFEGPANDVLSIQDDVARAISSRIQGKLHFQPKETTYARKPIDPDAYEAYLRGLYFFDKRQAEAFDKSVQYFRKAIARDPDFAPAYAGLAEALPARNWFHGTPSVDAMPEAKAAAKRALELDDRLAEAHTALGALLSLYDWNWREAEKELKRALELNPNSSLAHERYMMWLLSAGRLPEAVVEAERAQQLDPLSFFMNRELGHSLYVAGEYDEALEQLRKSEELEPHSKDVVRNWIAWIYELQGKQKDAVELDLLHAADKGIPQVQIDSMRKAYAEHGWKGYWRKSLHIYSLHKGTACYEVALAEARLGHADQTWEWMEKSADQREVWVTWIKVDPLLDSVRSHPAYKHLLRRINLAD